MPSQMPGQSTMAPGGNLTSSSKSSPGMGVETLFRTKPLQDVRVILRETQKALNQKKSDLRMLVGDNYREVIESSDLVFEHCII